jgi:hypothetical protein
MALPTLPTFFTRSFHSLLLKNAVNSSHSFWPNPPNSKRSHHALSLKKDVNSEGCYKLINEINSSVNADKYLFISFYPQEKNDEIILLSNINFLLSKLTKDLNIIVNLPVELPFNGNTCLITFKDCDFSKSYLINNSATKRDVFNKLNIINPRVVSFDLLDLLCNKDNCNLNANNNKNILIFRDNIHLTLKGSQYLTSKFDIWFLDLLKKKF